MGIEFFQSFSTAMHPADVITGYYYDVNFGVHGFLRARDGTLTTFDVPGGHLTIPTGINPAGKIAGSYSAASDFTHGFVRARDGTFTMSDPPGSIGTSPTSINPVGAITGYYSLVNFVAVKVDSFQVCR